MKSSSGFKAKPAETQKPRSSLSPRPVSPAEQRKAQQQSLQKSTLRALECAKREAAEHGVSLSEWEAEFINSVSERVRTYGRAFADPDKGAVNGTLSARQGMKLREIRKKAQSGKAETAQEEE